MLHQLLERSDSWQRFSRVSWHPGKIVHLQCNSLFLAGGWLAGIAAQRRVLLVTAEAQAAQRAAGFIEAWGGQAWLLPQEPSSTNAFYAAESASPAQTIARRQALEAWRHRAAGVLVLTPHCLAMTFPRDHGALTLTLHPGKEFTQDTLRRTLVSFGYQELPQVQDAGDFAVRGSIVDVYPDHATHPFRLDFFGDQLTDLRQFDPGTQISFRQVTTAEIPCRRPFPITTATRNRLKKILRAFPDNSLAPIKEALAANQDHPYCSLLDRELQLATSIDQLVPEGTMLACYHSQAISRQMHSVTAARAAARQRLAFPAAFTALLDRHYPDPQYVLQRLRQLPGLDIDALKPATPGFRFTGKHYPEFHAADTTHRDDSFWDRLQGWPRSIVFAAPGQPLQQLRDQLAEHQLPFSTQLPGTITQVSGICLCPRALPEPVAVYVHDLGTFFHHLPARTARTGRYRKRFRDRSDTAPLTALFDLTPGDHIVHLDFGIGRYLGLERLTGEDVAGDYIKIAYAGDDFLYVPVDKFHLLHKYIGGEEQPKLNNLHGGRWAAVKRRLHRRVQVLARDLLRTQAIRASRRGTAFPAASSDALRFAAGFPHTETFDQAKAIDAVAADLESPESMDRLICGDVGYGKTEVALRAACKVVSSGKQVALLAPTTLLAQQHYNTFRARFAGFPCTIDMLSRFRTAREQRQAIARAQRGDVDILIGTHRLLSRDVGFLDLGLVIIDEEQRFGVRQKEYLKSLRATVDILTLSATPIPRTLHQALSGLRDISIIDTPPPAKQSIVTFVGPHDLKLEQRAVARELARKGQVFYIFNRVEGIGKIAAGVRSRYPGATVAIAHGQMDERELEVIMRGFIAGVIDILVATSIIESGLDLPNVNTLIVRDAYRFGLADLYQLRGRIGRAGRKAFAYFFYPVTMPLSEKARERLEALETFTELGAGWQLAMRDMEIRGVGNLLGPEQHGLLIAVGVPLYSQLLEEAILQLQGIPTRADRPLTLDLPASAFVPADYLPDEKLRLKIYKRIAQACDPEQLTALCRELADRFGPLPLPVQQLLLLANIRQLAEFLGIEKISIRDRSLRISFPANRQDLLTPAGLTAAGWQPAGKTRAHYALPDPDPVPDMLLTTVRSCLQRLATEMPVFTLPSATV